MSLTAGIPRALLCLFAALFVVWSSEVVAGGKRAAVRLPAGFEEAARYQQRYYDQGVRRSAAERAFEPHTESGARGRVREPPIRLRANTWRPTDRAEGDSTTVDQQRGRILQLQVDREVRKLQLGTIVLPGELKVEREEPVKEGVVEDWDNRDARQRQPIRNILRDLDRDDPSSIYLLRSDPITPSHLLRYLPEAGFATRMVSDPLTFRKNMERLRNRRAWHDVKIFDFSPKSRRALETMQLHPGTWRQWRRASKRIGRRARPEHLEGTESVEQFFETLREMRDGAVVLIFAHSDGKYLWLDTGRGLVPINKERIRRELKGVYELPAMVLLSCKTTLPPEGPRAAGRIRRSGLAAEFLELGSPLVFATEREVPVNDATRFVEKFERHLEKGDGDAVDALFDTSRDTQLPTWGPMSSRRLLLSTIIG